MEGRGEFLRDLCGRIREFANELPVSTGEEEYEDDVDEQEKEISRRETRVNDDVYFTLLNLLFKEGVFNPTPSRETLNIGEG